MRSDEAPETVRLSFSDIGDIFFRAERGSQVDDEGPNRPPTYRVALGREPIDLGIVEFRILLFLANKPYRAFTRRHIAEAVTTEDHPVTVDSVDRYIASLRHQLGFFHDFVQSVPYIGYRFKA